MSSFRFDLTKAKLRAAEIAANAKLGRMPSAVDIVFLCEIVRDLANYSLAQDETINAVGSELQSLVDSVKSQVN